MRRTRSELCAWANGAVPRFVGLKSDTTVRLSASQTVRLTDHHGGVGCAPLETIRLNSLTATHISRNRTPFPFLKMVLKH